MTGLVVVLTICSGQDRVGRVAEALVNGDVRGEDQRTGSELRGRLVVGDQVVVERP
jgi:hypothetical protein